MENCHKSDNNTACLECQLDFYISNGHCVTESFYYNDTTSKSEMISLLGASKEFCIRYSGTACSKCCSGKVLSNNKCCAAGQYSSNGSTCANQPTTLTDCIKVASSGTACEECDSSKYLTNEHCCAEGQYYNSGCTGITFNATCLRSDNNTTCTKCPGSQLLSGTPNKFCCPKN